ncbi:MAG: DNA methyltransferase [Pirellula sp.]
MGSRQGDWVLDPFGGSGTTGIVANQLERDAMLVELNPEYAQTANDRGRHLERNGYTCQMCSVAAGDPDPLGGDRTVGLTMGHIIDKSKGVQ